MSNRLTRIAIVSSDRCEPKKCRQECKKSCPVVKTDRGADGPRSCSSFGRSASTCRSVALPWQACDEPSAYLDSERRIVAAKVIKRFILHAKKTAFVHLDITFRRDPTNYRPRINKLDSTKDREQKYAGSYYYLDD